MRSSPNEDATVTNVMEALPADLALMFFIANRAGLRTGEAAGLTMGDMEWISEGKIRVAHSWGGPLKEDRRGVGKLKWAPAPDDLADRMRLHLGRRRLAGAGPDDLVFVAPVRERAGAARRPGSATGTNSFATAGKRPARQQGSISPGTRVHVTPWSRGT